MAYCFENDESVAQGVRRIACSELESAVEELGEHGPGDDERVHSVRKRMKKLRALVALIRPVIGDELYREENARFRDVAKKLASKREAFAVLATFDDLVSRNADQVAPEAFGELRTRVREHLNRDSSPEDRAIALALLRDASERPLAWPLEIDGFGLIRRGLERTYRRARRAFSNAYEIGESEAFHEWRKRTKAHWYHLRLLVPSWPGPLGTLESELHRLSELLGDEHDLADLELALARVADPATESAAGMLGTLLLRRREELRGQARALGERVFGERPAELARRFRRYFEAWQAEHARAEGVSANGAGVDESHDAVDDSGVAQDAHVS